MKKLFTLLALVALVSCSGSHKDEPKQIKKIVCGDSVETEMFDVNGNSIMVKSPGKCDTVLVTEEIS